MLDLQIALFLDPVLHPVLHPVLEAFLALTPQIISLALPSSPDLADLASADLASADIASADIASADIAAAASF
ncbi:hypothetical protein EYZ11_005712 [Aspergillus tanneri]|uniref:Uncharacterized protein n=1 Tax=Aspergillus tanneri TaxID=1220188 RepID=A0A4S3JHU1_9EURO|nr:hypothetical protein EYZ11_005712 [Aspergillus tanneri]